MKQFHSLLCNCVLHNLCNSQRSHVFDEAVSLSAMLYIHLVESKQNELGEILKKKTRDGPKTSQPAQTSS